MRDRNGRMIARPLELLQSRHPNESSSEEAFLLRMHAQFVVCRFQVRVALQYPSRDADRITVPRRRPLVEDFQSAHVTSQRTVVHEVVPNADGRDLTTDNAVFEMPGKHNIVQTFTTKADV